MVYSDVARTGNVDICVMRLSGVKISRAADFHVSKPAFRQTQSSRARNLQIAFLKIDLASQIAGTLDTYPNSVHIQHRRVKVNLSLNIATAKKETTTLICADVQRAPYLLNCECAHKVRRALRLPAMFFVRSMNDQDLTGTGNSDIVAVDCGHIFAFASRIAR